jgi:hypothetical protein
MSSSSSVKSIAAGTSLSSKSSSSSSSSSNSSDSSNSTSDDSSDLDTSYDGSYIGGSSGYTINKDGNKVDKSTGMVIKVVRSSATTNTSDSSSSKVIKVVTALISSINNKGVVTVEFSEDMIIPENYTRFNYLFMDVSTISNDGVQVGVNKNISAWKITNFESSTMTLQVNFTDPMVISQSIVKDKLSIMFIANGYFESLSSSNPIDYLYSIKSDIPTQLSVSKSTDTLSSAGSATSSAMNGIVYGNLALQIFMSASL